MRTFTNYRTREDGKTRMMKLLKVEEVAPLWGMTKYQLWSAIRENKVKGVVRIGGRIRIVESAVEQMLNDQTIGANSNADEKLDNAA